MRIIAIDPGRHCGWALLRPEALQGADVVTSGVEGFRRRRGENDGGMFRRFNAWLRQKAEDTYISGCECPRCQKMGIPVPEGAGAVRCDACGVPWHPNPGGLDLIVYEMPHHRGGAATWILVGMATRIQEFAEGMGADCVPVHTGTLKKWATGNGRASKADMVEAACSLWHFGDSPPTETMDDNEADARLLLAYARERFGTEPVGKG